MPRSAWAGFALAGRHSRQDGEAGLRLTLRDKMGLATLIAADGQESALSHVLAERYGLLLPEAGTTAMIGEGGLIWSAPGQWLAVAETRRGLDGLADAVKGIAAITDQSDARATVRISGPGARQLLLKGVTIDLHPRAFRAGHAAVTSVAHISTQIWQRDEAPTYDLTVARSFAGSFWSWLSHASAEFGYEIFCSAP